MNNKGMKGLAVIVAAGLLTTSCDLLKDVDYKVTPDPLELKGDSVQVKIDVTLPEKSLNKKAYVEVVPSIAGHALKTIKIVGEKATANGTVIPYKAGGKIVYKDVIAYSPDMEISALDVTGNVYKKGKLKKQLDTAKIAAATIVTQQLVNKDFKVIYAKDNFQRVTQEQQKAVINFLKGRHNIRSTELRDQDIKDLSTFLAAAQNNPKIKITNIDVEGYASLEGEEDSNNTLSTNRAEVSKAETIKLAKAKKVSNATASDEANYTAKGNGEDFTGFKMTLEKSDMKKEDKDRILRILKMQHSATDREQAIHDLSTYLFLDKNIFPEQRRAEINVNYDLTGYSDEELKQLSKTNIDTLNLEEILFTATLTDDLNEQLRLYKAAAERFPNDYRPVNNIGVIYYKQNNMGTAKTQFENAEKIKENAVSKNNLAAIAGVNGDRQKAKDLLGEASGAGDQVSYNKGILAIQDGKYGDAISDFGSDASFNKGLAQLLNKQEADAQKTIDNSDAKETAKGYYLKAIIAAHNSNLTDIVSNLKNAFSKDASLKKKAMTDREFVKYFDNASFSSIVK